MPGEFEEGDILFAHAVQNANRAEFFAGEPDDLASRTAELTLQRLHPLDRCVEMPLKKSFENFHELRRCRPKDNIGHMPSGVRQRVLDSLEGLGLALNTE